MNWVKEERRRPDSGDVRLPSLAPRRISHTRIRIGSPPGEDRLLAGECAFNYRRFALLMLIFVAATAHADPPPSTDSLQTVLVSVTPVMGTEIPLAQVPSNVQTLRAAQLASDHDETITDAVERH